MYNGIITSEEINDIIASTSTKMLNEKNFNAINKIIGELAYKDFQVAKVKHGRNIDSYSLGTETLEAMKIKYDYANGWISEEEYKGFCLRYNLRTVKERGLT